MKQEKSTAAGTGSWPRAAMLLSLALLAATITAVCSRRTPPAPESSALGAEKSQPAVFGSLVYDEGRHVLVVTYRNGAVYEYADVPREVYLGFMAAPVREVYFSTYIRDRYPARITVSAPPLTQTPTAVPTPAKPAPPGRGRGRGRGR